MPSYTQSDRAMILKWTDGLNGKELTDECERLKVSRTSVLNWRKSIDGYKNSEQKIDQVLVPVPAEYIHELKGRIQDLEQRERTTRAFLKDCVSYVDRRANQINQWSGKRIRAKTLADEIKRRITDFMSVHPLMSSLDVESEQETKDG